MTHRRTCCLAVLTLPFASACVNQHIDDIIAEYGVTYIPTSTGEASGSTASTSGSTTRTTADTTAADTTGPVPDLPSEDTTTTDATTGPPPTFCGDGIVQDDETCDDANDILGDGCQFCARDTLVFVSSQRYQGWAIGGINAADQRCRGLALAAGLARPESYRAWLSTPSMPVSARFNHSRGRYTLVNGTVIADDWDALTSGVLLHPILVDEFSQIHDFRAWTGTLASGDAAPGSNFCGDWALNTGDLQYGGNGFTTAVDATWSFWDDDAECGFDLHLYCFEQ
jgi:cysteine-rich repeat protein